MNKLVVFIVLLALGSLQIDAKKAKKHEARKEETKQSEEETKQSEDKIEQPEDEPEIKGFFPGFAIRIPVPNFGILSNIRERLDDLFTGNKPVGLSDFVPSSDKSGKFKTTTKVKNSTRGPFKTYSISSQTVSTDNKSSPHVVSQVFKSLTTLDKTKLPKGKDGKVQIPSMEFELGPFASPLLDAGEEVSFSSIFLPFSVFRFDLSIVLFKSGVLTAPINLFVFSLQRFSLYSFEIDSSLEKTLKRLATFAEKLHQIRSKR